MFDFAVGVLAQDDRGGRISGGSDGYREQLDLGDRHLIGELAKFRTHRLGRQIGRDKELEGRQSAVALHYDQFAVLDDRDGHLDAVKPAFGDFLGEIVNLLVPDQLRDKIGLRCHRRTR